MLSRLLHLPGFKLENRASVLRALQLYANTKLDFGDCLIVASMEHRGSKVLYSYDTRFDRISTITRRAPARA